MIKLNGRLTQFPISERLLVQKALFENNLNVTRRKKQYCIFTTVSIG
jgi:hypothetical protein